tara:strand:- start:8420 stop:9970 length:1551 start_codon:yes stop_codon:yes gene_type:complete
MGGGLMQIATFSDDDKYIIGNPQITYFKSIYRRHTNFAIESIEQVINGEYHTDNTETNGTVTISKNADLVSKVSVVCPQTDQGINGNELIDSVELVIGGTLIDKQTNEWMKIWNELTIESTKKEGYRYMSGSYNNSTIPPKTGQSTIIIPLQFWFCRYIGSSLPLIALQYHDIILKFKWGKNEDINRDKNTTRSSECSVWCDYIFLDEDERRKFTETSHEYLIEQVQTVDTSISAPSRKYALNQINHHVKELIWVEGGVGGNEKYTLTFNGIERFSERYKEYFTLEQPLNYHTSIPEYNIKEKDNYQYISPIIIAYHDDTHNGNINDDVGDALYHSASVSSGGETDVTLRIGDSYILMNSPENLPLIGDILLIETKDKNAYIGTDKLLKRYQKISGRVTEITTGVNSRVFKVVVKDPIGQVSTNFKESDVNDLVDISIIARYQNIASGCSDYSKNIYVYSFALSPEEHQPSGSCNFSRLNDIKLSISSSVTIDKVYALSYNILRFSNGLSSLLYVN